MILPQTRVGESVSEKLQREEILKRLDELEKQSFRNLSIALELRGLLVKKKRRSPTELTESNVIELKRILEKRNK
jgi:hypothetical protein